MFNHMGGGGVVQSDMNVSGGQYTSQGMHQRNKTQVMNGAEQANDSVFRSSIMSNEQLQKIVMTKTNPQNLRQSANAGKVGRIANSSF
jgi:hypothetical protein